MPLLGRAALVVCLGLTLYAVVAGSVAAFRGSRRMHVSARNALVAALIADLVAMGVLLAAFVRRDFSITYVAEHTSRHLPQPYVETALWGGQQGSLLLWLTILLGIGSAAVLLNRKLVADVIPWTVPVLGGVSVFFAWMLVAVASPFDTQVAPVDGAGLNPSLQNPYMMIHPPMLYLGYVGLTVPFAFAMGAMLSGRNDERWIVATRRWTLAAFMFLGIGILLGAKWAYEEVGWGGYYAWDPVENAALMPWLAATAFLHSVMVQEKKNMLRVWNVVLVSLAFCLSLFGTFLTRSGVISSIHSFSQSTIGPWFLGFIAVVSAFCVTVIFWRLPLLRTKTRLESLVSREAAFLYNNLLLVAFALTVLWGVAYPLLSEAVRGETVTVGPPYYNFFLRVFGLPLLLLMGIGPLVAWRRSSLRAVRASLTIPALFALACGGVLLLAGAGSSVPGLVGYTFSAFAFAAIVLEFVRGTRARKALGASSWADAFASLVARNRRRYGGYVVHFAIVLLAVGVIGSSAYGSTKISQMQPGRTLRISGYTLTYLGSFERRKPNHEEARARFDVTSGGSDLGVLSAGQNQYFAEQQTSNEVAIRHDWKSAGDLFVIANDFRGRSVAVKVLVHPLVNLIWLGGLVFLLGSLITLWPDRREQRRLAAHAAEPGALAGA